MSDLNAPGPVTPEVWRLFLRHALATVAYRGAKALRGAPAGFGDFRAGPTSRTPLEILGHIGDLYDWMASMLAGDPKWVEDPLESWEKQEARFFAALARVDALLAASNEALPYPVERIFQGPVADSLTHIGQLNYLRRLAEAPVRGESYNRADITIGHVGADQPPARNEFD